MTQTRSNATSALQRPGVWPSRVVRLAARMLPAGAVRERYRAEFLAELYGMSHPRQARHSLRVLLCVWALRMAVTSQGPVAAEEAGMKINVQRRPILCRLNLHHTWVMRSTEDGGRYRQCARCGKDSSKSNGPMDGAAGIGAISGM
jgi:hypothetical protein